MTDTTIDLSQNTVTLTVTPVAGPQGPAGPAGPAGAGMLTPGGRLTIVSGQPEMPQTTDYTSTTLYYAPFESDQIPLFNGTSWGSYTFSASDLDTVGLSFSAGSAWAANTQYDVFVTLNNGVPVLCTGPAWTSSAMSTRGLVRKNGLWVNSVAVTVNLSATSQLSVAAYQATWVGAINIGTTAGTLTATFTLGQLRRCDVWNAYNQREIILGVGCPPVSGALVQWTPQNQYPAWQAFNNDLKNSGFYFTGMPQNVHTRYIQRGFINSISPGGACALVATICKDSISTQCGNLAVMSTDYNNIEMSVSVEAVFNDRSSIGAHQVFMGTANANTMAGITMWGLNPTASLSQEEAHAMWISYMG